MKNSLRKGEPSQFLTGWKEIANYLGKGVRTVQRYEVELGLPIRRPAGRSCGSVVATRAELDAWVSASPIREALQLTRSAPVPAAFAAEHIKTGMLEMRRLRDQMVDLRSEVMESIQLLWESIQGLHGESHQDRRQAAPPLTVLEHGSASRSLHLLAMDIKHRRAS